MENKTATANPVITALENTVPVNLVPKKTPLENGLPTH